jgi:cytosine deaminase
MNYGAVPTSGGPLKHDAIYLQAAIAQAKKSLREGGIPIGAALVVDETIVGLGHNRRVQLNDAILHAETDCIRNAGRLTPAEYRRATIYTTLSPCAMCSGTVLLFGIPRVVIGENKNYVGSEQLLLANNVLLEFADNAEIAEILGKFIEEHPELWHEDIGKLDH